MYSLEERTKAVKLYNESTVIRILGYPSPNNIFGILKKANCSDSWP